VMAPLDASSMLIGFGFRDTESLNDLWVFKFQYHSRNQERSEYSVSQLDLGIGRNGFNLRPDNGMDWTVIAQLDADSRSNTVGRANKLLI